MPVFSSGPGQAPVWCEMKQFDIVELEAGSSFVFERQGAREKLIIGEGSCRIDCGSGERLETKGANLDLADSGNVFRIAAVVEDATLIRMCGDWGDDTGGSGLFSVSPSSTSSPADSGDGVDYEKKTTFDSHYHDCDEYWIIFQGSGIAVSEGVAYDVGPGDCVATGMGFHHDFPTVQKPVRAVYFETTLQGTKRRGHLWDHTHGAAQPQLDRV